MMPQTAMADRRPGHERYQLAQADDPTTMGQEPIIAATEAIDESRRVRAQAADEIAAWCVILNHAA
jgi:hypothetical protein